MAALPGNLLPASASVAGVAGADPRADARHYTTRGWFVKIPRVAARSTWANQLSLESTSSAVNMPDIAIRGNRSLQRIFVPRQFVAL